jgi:hypothetical protein
MLRHRQVTGMLNNLSLCGIYGAPKHLPTAKSGTFTYLQHSDYNAHIALKGTINSEMKVTYEH